jgi:tRNA pseudouridine 55 synthase
VDGFLFIDKPAGPTSFAVVKHARSFCKRCKIGHAGTLDPMASGLLIIALGKATRLLEFLPTEPKLYSFTIRFGSETDTLDTEGTITHTGGRIPGEDEIKSVLPRFVGKQMQVPPRFSALKIKGERAYDLARENKDFSLAPRPVIILSLSCETFHADRGEAHCTLSCSKGTYVRSLVRDIGEALGTFAHASGIRRTAIGPFSLDQAIAFDKIDESTFKNVVPIKTMFGKCPQTILSRAQKEALSYGKSVQLAIDGKAGDTVFAFDEKDDIVAVLMKKDRGTFHPVKVFANKAS